MSLCYVLKLAVGDLVSDQDQVGLNLDGLLGEYN